MLFLHNGFLAELAFHFPNCLSQNSCIFLHFFISLISHFGVLFPFICPSSKIYFGQIYCDFCLIPYWGKEGIITLWYPITLILFACFVLHVAWSNNLQVPFGERNLLFKCTVGGTYDLRERFKLFSYHAVECLNPCSPALVVLTSSFKMIMILY